jgi:hypothetical protein
MAELQANDGKKRRRYGKEQIDDDEEEDGSFKTTLNTAANTPLMAALVKTIWCLWESVSQSIDEWFVAVRVRSILCLTLFLFDSRSD